MLIDREKVKLLIENETRVWLKTVIEMSMNFCGGFEAFISSLEKTGRKRETKIIYGTSDNWRLVFYFNNDEYKFVLLN